MARAMGRSIETEQRYALAKLRRDCAPPTGEAVRSTPGRWWGVGVLAAVVESVAVLMIGLTLSSAALHVVSQEPSCAGCVTEATQ